MDDIEVRRRIVAARILLDIDQAEMSDRGHDAGLGIHELARVERGDRAVQRHHLLVLCEVLDVPMSWFTEPRQVIVAQKASDYARLVNQLFELSQPPEGERTRPLRVGQGRQPKQEAPRGKRRRAS